MTDYAPDPNWQEELPYKNETPDFKPKHQASCHCGAVKYSASEDPVSAVVCCCTTCQVVHGAGMQWAAIFKKEHIKFKEESVDQLEFYNTHEHQPGRHPPCKVSCKTCGTLIADEGRNMWLAFPGLFKFPRGKHPPAFTPTDFIFYGQRIFDVSEKKDVNYWEGAKGDSDKHDFSKGGVDEEVNEQENEQRHKRDKSEMETNGKEADSPEGKKHKKAKADT